MRTKKYVKRKKVYRRKRGLRKRMVRRRAIPLISNGPGLGNRFVCKMKYAEQITILPDITTPQSFSFRANDVYDPNYTSSGHSAMGFNQICGTDGFYEEFRVIGSRIRARMCGSENVAGLTTFYFGIDTTRESAAFSYSSVSQWLEQGTKSKVKVLSLSTGSNGMGLQASQVSTKWSAKKAIPKNQIGDQSQIGTYISSPTDNWLYNINYAFAGNQQVDGRVFILVEIDYIVIFSKSMPILPSS